jgi:phage shock protein A
MNNTIQTIDTTMQEPTQFDLNSIFISALTQAITQATAPLVARIAELETKLNNLQDTNANFIKEIAEEVADAKMAEHTDEYDHYEMECQIERIDDKIEEKVNEAIDDLDISDKINDALNGATVSISV